MFHRRGRGWPGSRGFLGGHGLSRMCVEVVPGRGTPSDERAARTEGGGCPRTMVWLNWVGCGAYGRREACGAWLRCLWAAAGPGRASRSITPSEARVWRSRGRAAAHRRNRPDQVGRPRAARKCGGEDVARERGGEGAERSSWRGRRAGGQVSRHVEVWWWRCRAGAR